MDIRQRKSSRKFCPPHFAGSPAPLPWSTEATTGVKVLINKGDGTFHPAASYPVVQPNAIAIGDFDGDGNPDVVVTSNHGANPARVTVLMNGL